MKGRYIIMKNLKKTVKVGAFAAGVLMAVAFIIKVTKVTNNMTKKQGGSLQHSSFLFSPLSSPS